MKLHRRWRWLLVGCAGLILAAAAGAWLMFQRVPSWYRPMAIAPGDQRVKDDLLYAQQRFGDMLSAESDRFEYRITQDQVNAWLAVREDIDPLSRHWLPPELSDPFIRFDSEGIMLAVTWTGDGLSCVMSARLHVSATEQGLAVRLVSVEAGALPVPEEWVRDALQRSDATGWPAGEKLRNQRSDQPLPRLADLLTGGIFPDAWVIPRFAPAPFAIRDLRVEPGAVVATIERLPYQPGSR